MPQTRLIRPQLADADRLDENPAIDFESVLAPLLAQRTATPILHLPQASEVAEQLDTTVPLDGDNLDAVIAGVSHAIACYPRRNTHPGFFGWISPSGVGSDVLANAMVAAVNQNIGGYWSSPVGTVMERTFIGWMRELAGFPHSADGVILSGGSLANTTAIAAALANHYGSDYRQRGLLACAGENQPVLLCSQAAHFSIRRAAALLGLGADNVIAIDTDEQFRLRTDLLEQALDEHSNIVCVVATAGTTNTGAIDPLDDIAALCQQHKVWLHIDAAYGAGGLMADELKPRYQGIERADSITMDMHKWFFQSLDGSVLLYRDPGAARELFYDSSDYLRSDPDPAPEQHMFFHLSPELSRRFRALPFYIAFRHYGIARLGRNVLNNVYCAEYLAELIQQENKLELIVAPQLSILCFRYRREGMSDEKTDKLNSAIRDRIQQEGNYLMSATLVHKRPVLRVCIVNHATRAKHVEGLLESVLRIGQLLIPS